MNPSAKFLCVVLLLCGISCSPGSRSYDVYIDSNDVRSGPERNDELVENLDALTSSNFFEHTQAARHLINMGPSIISELLRNKHLLRESNDTIVPVCQSIIEIIFSLQKKAWVIGKLDDPTPEIREIALADLKRRAEEEKKEEKVGEWEKNKPDEKSTSKSSGKNFKQEVK